MINFPKKNQLYNWLLLLRWNKPSGRLILLIPSGWALWLTPTAPPPVGLLALIIVGGLCVSGAGCIANDIWDKNFDKEVQRTKNRPLAKGLVQVSTAYNLLYLMLVLSLLIVLLLPSESQKLCLILALCSLPPILLYPSTKRWFKYPQAILSICWGFAVLIPWAASQSSLSGGIPLLSCSIATMTWTFGFDTVYAMADKEDDEILRLKSSALSLGKNSNKVISFCYAITCCLIAIGANSTHVGSIFWPLWLVASIGMQREVNLLAKRTGVEQIAISRRHFINQVWLGALILLGLVLGHAN